MFKSFFSRDTDYIPKDLPDDVKEIYQSQGIHKQILETRVLNKIANHLKYSTLWNFVFLFLGASSTYYVNYHLQQKSNELHKERTLQPLYKTQQEIVEEVHTIKDETDTLKIKMEHIYNELEKLKQTQLHLVNAS